MKNGIRNIGIYMAVILLVVCGIYYFMSQNTKKDDYTYRDFVKDYNASNIAEIKLYQYKEQPTGKMLIELKDGKKHTIQISSTGIYFDDDCTDWRRWRRKDDELQQEPRKARHRHEQTGNI